MSQTETGAPKSRRKPNAALQAMAECDRIFAELSDKERGQVIAYLVGEWEFNLELRDVNNNETKTRPGHYKEDPGIAGLRDVRPLQPG